ncbi:MAG: class I SAM-dependent methyltransferase [Candidatus Binatia bacterium]
MMRIRTPWIFTLGAGVYDALTAQEPWRRHCRALATGLRASRVLDLGIGPGVSGIELLRADPEIRLVGLDCSASMLTRARRHGSDAGVDLALIRGDAARLPFIDAAYDGAIGHSFLYLLADSDAVLREVHRVVRPGGTVGFLEPSNLGGRARGRALLDAYRIGGRFGTSMLLWTVFSALHGRYTPQRLASQLAHCGFIDTHVAPALNGLGLMATASRP